METKLETFRATFEAARRNHLIAQGYTPAQIDLHRRSWEASVKFGRKYANVDCGGSGVYMVVLNTGEIYGIKGYGVIHRGHFYGTLDTINEWDWSGYTAHKLKQAA